MIKIIAQKTGGKKGNQHHGPGDHKAFTQVFGKMVAFPAVQFLGAGKNAQNCNVMALMGPARKV